MQTLKLSLEIAEITAEALGVDCRACFEKMLLKLSCYQMKDSKISTHTQLVGAVIWFLGVRGYIYRVDSCSL